MCLKTIGKMFTGTVDIPSPADIVSPSEIRYDENHGKLAGAITEGNIIAAQGEDFNVIHRVKQIKQDSQGRRWVLKGDNNWKADSFEVRDEHVKWLLVGTIYQPLLCLQYKILENAPQTRPNHHLITTQSLPKIPWKPLSLSANYVILNVREIFSTIVIT